MDHMKDTLSSEWDVTDLGEPHKIVGIEVTCTNNSISISQQKYIESLLCKENMQDANPAAIPMDPNIKLTPNLDNNELNCSNSSQIPHDWISAMQSINWPLTPLTRVFNTTVQ